MGKVTFEFNEKEDSFDIRLVANRKRLMSVLWDFNNYVRKINKGCARGTIMVSGDKVLGDISDAIPEEYVNKEKRFYIEDEEIMRKINCLLKPIEDLLEDYN